MGPGGASYSTQLPCPQLAAPPVPEPPLPGALSRRTPWGPLAGEGSWRCTAGDLRWRLTKLRRAPRPALEKRWLPTGVIRFLLAANTAFDADERGRCVQAWAPLR
ncbi:hypothetical protein NDU88_011747 [Pleurodeles waltl]|uniref:Uncharacterized protein n=1 Tax=Pleurodeles waltl TaxID=8319 RepID=A0AAV7QY64_PLEWA|nr:hypothetical protein NDU88_011747 [Pleurodeles waltl]